MRGQTAVTTPAVTASEGPLIFISAAEPSADVHGASLIRAVQRACPEARFAGVAGPAMRAAGCWSIFDMSGRSAMLLAALGAARDALRMWATARRHLASYPFDAAVLIDAPTLHLPLAKRAKQLGVPVFYYIAPQVWAWGESRIGRIRRRIERLAVIFPFEEEYFRSRGVNATFVGHPLFETLLRRRCDQTVVDEIRGRGDPVVAIFPGSRRHVVREVLPGQLEVAARIASQNPRVHFGVSLANPQVRPIVTPLVEQCGLNTSIRSGQNGELLTAADLALVASGTATLETAYYHKPMVIMYRSSKWGYRLVGRWLIRTPHLSLVNILAGRELVPEFMPYYTSTEPIAEKALELLASPERRARMESALAKLVEPFLRPGAADRTAVLLLELVEKSRRQKPPSPVPVG